MRKTISTITLALTLATVAVAPATAASTASASSTATATTGAAAAGASTAASRRTAQPAWLPDVWWRLATCETRANWQHDSGTFQGAFGIYKGTWDTYRLPGFPTEAHLATPKQQYRVALRIAANHTMYAWGCYRVIR